MRVHYRTAFGKSPHRRISIALLRMVAIVAAVVPLWPLPTMEAMGQSTPQILLYDVGPGSNPPPAATSPASRLFELVTKQQWSEAGKLAQELALAEPNDPAISYYLGLTRLHFQDSIGAIRALRAAERLGMDTAYFHQVLGIAYYNVHQFILFQQQMEESIALAPADYKSYYYVGRYFESIRNDFPGALEYFAKATRLNPEHTESSYYRGFCLEVSGRHAEARSAYEAAIKSVEKRQERFSLPYQGIARLLAEEAPAEALEFGQKAVELEPNLDSNHVVMAKIYERLGRLSEAAEELQTAERLDPTNASPRFVLARIYSKVGKHEAAEAELAIFKKINQVYGPQ
jgi:tetratricopeptide (TPR) repeat protein